MLAGVSHVFRPIIGKESETPQCLERERERERERDRDRERERVVHKSGLT